jgi:proteasome lid subunit RPN8/RPN11
MDDLRRRGGGRRESGAFLLSELNAPNGVVRAWLAYDELAPESLAYNYVRLESAAFSRLWDWCSCRGLSVVADVHTHPLGPRQSPSDRANPMVSIIGHIALIVPRFAQGKPRPRDVSLNVYRGGGKWTSFYRRAAEALLVVR